MKNIKLAAIFFTLCFAALANANDSGGITVTPEPSMVILLAAGLSGIGITAWRRNRKQ
ncbi:MAG TPA: PEP-CTERM sorting domain-containing protein [Bryobacteraceae bacterium]|nr:PEP-CTERM sorting domain-containing protein [Bryobacteraceae bacterium]